MPPIGTAHDPAHALELTLPGSYCLRVDLDWMGTGAAIRIRSGNVNLDFHGHVLRGAVEQPGQVGVLVEDGAHDVQIRNGEIEHMQVGVRAQEVNRFVMHDMILRQITWFGVHVSGQHNVVEDSTMENLGLINEGGKGEAYAVGILAGGSDMQIKGNRFHNVLRQPGEATLVGEGVGVLLSADSRNISLISNTFSVDKETRKSTFGVWARTSDIQLEGNRFQNVEAPIAGAYAGTSRLLNNIFETDESIASIQTKAVAGTKHVAVAMQLGVEDGAVFERNSFRGFPCAIQLHGNAMRPSIKIGKNTVQWPGGKRNCSREGRWIGNVVFALLPKLTK